MLEEFGLDFDYFRKLILSVQVNPIEPVTALQSRFREALLSLQDRWRDKPSYPESSYEADFGLEKSGRWIFLEIELSDIRRAMNAIYMSRVFRTGYMRLRIFMAPESSKPEQKLFYSSLVRRYEYLAPEFPLWVIGFTYP
jgi:hypothetical protein